MIFVDDYTINSANLGPCNPLPDIKNVSYIHAKYKITENVSADEKAGIGKGMISTMLPYKLQDGYDRNRSLRKYKAIFVENKYLRAVFLPELGGRLWSLFDKEGNRELLYKNTVFQPANLALRNAWFSGGIEFNVGIKGHSPLTCSSVFADIVKYKDGSQVLKLYEFERIREITYSISVYLPEDSKLLYIQERIENTSDNDKYSYWWSNIAVPQTEDTRVIVPTDESFLSSYNDGNYIVDKIRVPMHEGRDVSYPKNSPRSQDFFYKIAKDEAKWIAAVQGDGKGLIQFSDKTMIGRKLFVWGQGTGGKHWGEWLSEKNQSYIEIQAGLAYTQLEHLPMKAHETFKWTEAYGALNCDPKMTHGENWEAAVNAVKNTFENKLDANAIENELSGVFPDRNDIISTDTVHYGSSWGAAENILRKRYSLKPISDTCSFPITSGSDEKQWFYLLENGEFPPVSPEDEPKSYVTGKLWRDSLEQAVLKQNKSQWYAFLQLGVYYYAQGENDKAEVSWLKSVELCDSAWGRRNLAMLYKNEYNDKDKAVSNIEKAVKLNSKCRGILIDCAAIYMSNKMYDKWLNLYNTLSDDLKTDGRLRLYKAISHMGLNQIDEACEIINENFEMCDIQEGEVSISHIWRQLYMMKIKRDEGISDEIQLQKRTDELYPLPESLDFRMHE